MPKNEWNVISNDVNGQYEYRVRHQDGWHGTTSMYRRDKETGEEEHMLDIPTQDFLALTEVSFAQSFKDRVVGLVKQA